LVLFAGIAAACSGTGGGGGCPAPSVSTGEATSITSDNATLTGSVNPQGCYTEYAFEYGRSSEGYPNEIGGSAGSGTSPVSVQTYSGLGLQPSTSYHFRLTAWNSGDETTGGSGSFTTPAACSKPTVTTEAASSITPYLATMNGTVNPGGCETMYKFEWGPSFSPSTYPYLESGYVGGTSPVRVSKPAQTLEPGQSYHFRISATNKAGASTPGADLPFTAPLDKDPILFVHGWGVQSIGMGGSALTFETYVNWFHNKKSYPYSHLYNWAYDTSKSNAVIAQEIATRVNNLLFTSKASKVDIITHSMGGLSSRYYLKKLGGTTKVEDWVSLGGPNHGTNAAYACFTVACEQMRPGSTFLKELNENDETPGAVRYGTWRTADGCDSIISPAVSVEVAGAALNKLVTPCVSHENLHETESIFNEVWSFVK
jgi:triacylglycerol lipase